MSYLDFFLVFLFSLIHFKSVMFLMCIYKIKRNVCMLSHACIAILKIKKKSDRAVHFQLGKKQNCAPRCASISKHALAFFLENFLLTSEKRIKPFPLTMQIIKKSASRPPSAIQHSARRCANPL